MLRAATEGGRLDVGAECLQSLFGREMPSPKERAALLILARTVINIDIICRSLTEKD